MVLIMLKEYWRDNIDLYFRMHGSYLTENIPDLKKEDVSHPRTSHFGERILLPPFSIMFK